MARRGNGKERGGWRVHEPPLVGIGEPGGLGPQGQLLGCTAGLCSGHSHRLTPGQGGEEVEVCVPPAGAHSLGGNVGTPHRPSPRARHKLQNNLFPVTHSWD